MYSQYRRSFIQSSRAYLPFHIMKCIGEELIEQVLAGCCEDPVVHERITAPMYRWIEGSAPGIRSSLGCPQKSLDYEPSIRMIHVSFFF